MSEDREGDVEDLVSDLFLLFQEAHPGVPRAQMVIEVRRALERWAQRESER